MRPMGQGVHSMYEDRMVFDHREEILAGHRAHERQLHVGVRVDAARHHQHPAGVHDLASGRRVEAGSDLGDDAVLAQHVGAEAVLGRHHGAATDQEGHRGVLHLWVGHLW